jgi:hypothetical protein
MSERKDNKTSINNDTFNNTKIKNEKSISYSLPNQNYNLKNKRALNKIKNKKTISTSELEFLYNDSQDKTIASNKAKKLIKKNIINRTLNQNSTDFISTKYQKYSRQNNYKNNFKTRTFNEFWSSVQEHEKEKKARIENLKQKVVAVQNKELKYHPFVSKRSLTLANLKKREPFYLKRPLNEERYLEGDFANFYKKYINIINRDKNMTIDETKTQEKFNKFYEDNITWKSNIIKNNQLVFDKKRKNTFDKKVYTFKPILNNNSLKIVEELDKFNELTLDNYNDLNNFEIDKKIMKQFKIRIKPILNEYLDIKNKRIPYVNRRSLNLIKSLTHKNRTKTLYRNKTYQIIPKTNIKTEEQKDNSTTKEEKDKEKLKYPKKRTYEQYILQKLKEAKKLDQKDKKGLYKLNIMQGTSTNNDYANKIMSNKKYSYIIEGFL